MARHLRARDQRRREAGEAENVDEDAEVADLISTVARQLRARDQRRKEAERLEDSAP